MSGALNVGKRRRSRHAGTEGAEAGLAVLAERQDAHETRDDDRFGSLNASLTAVRGEVRALTDKVDAIASDVGEIKGRIAGSVVASPAVGGLRLGARAWAALSALAMAAVSLIAWLGAQVYDLQPARIKASQSPQMVQLVRPPPP